MKRVFIALAILFLAMAYQPHSLLAGTDRTIEKSFPCKWGASSLSIWIPAATSR